MRLARTCLGLALLLGIAMSMPKTAFADVTLGPPDDTFVKDRSGSRSTNFDEDSNGLLVTATGFPSGTPDEIGYFRFDISGLTGTLTAARLRLYNLPTSPTGTVAVFATTSDDWNGSSSGLGGETTLTFNNAPAESTLLDTQTATHGWMQWSGSALTSYVSNNLSGNYLVTLRVKATSTGMADVNSYEDHEDTRGSGNLPVLILEGMSEDNAVVMSNFKASRVREGVRLSWHTESEFKHAGFRVLREVPGGSLELLTRGLIGPSSPGGELGGAEYEFIDRHAGPESQTYWLEDVDSSGRATRHGPVDVPAVAFGILRLPFGPPLHPTQASLTDAPR